MDRALTLLFSLFACANDAPVPAEESCAVQAEAWCEEAAACPEDAIVHRPEDVPACIAGLTRQCSETRAGREVDGAELDACLAALDAMQCTTAMGLPAECWPLWLP